MSKIFLFCLFLFILNMKNTEADELFVKSLMEGNSYFVKNAEKERLAELSKKQSPKIIVVTCSDSRIVPEYIFNAKIGDIFSIRVAGNVVDEEEVGSIEYAVGHLNVKNIVILGHTKCGAVNEAVHHLHTDSKNIDHILHEIEPSFKQCKMNLHVTKNQLDHIDDPDEEALSNELSECTIEKNIFHTSKRILEKSKILKDLHRKNKIEFYHMKYDLESGLIKEVKKNN